MRYQSHEPHAVRRSIDWRGLLTRAGMILCVGGGIVAVSTPDLGAPIFAAGLVCLLGSTAD